MWYTGNTMQVDRYRSFLRVSMLVMTTVLVFDSGVAFPITKQLSDNTVLYLASVGAGVGATATVPVNEINALSAQLREQKEVLDAREAALHEREITSRSFEVSGDTNYSTYIISTILFILTVLLVLNYAMDWARMRSLRYAK